MPVVIAAPRIVLRADAGHQLGSGHVMRLAALADAATARGGEAVVMVGGDASAVIDHLHQRGIPAVAAADTTAGDADVRLVTAKARRLGTTTVVIDGPGFTPAYVAALTAAGLRVTCVDDLGVAPLPTSAVINHNLSAEGLADRYPAASMRLLGRRFHLLRREFHRQPAGGPALAADARRILITMGGSDPAGGTARVLGALGGSGLTLVAVLGPGFLRTDEFARAVATATARGHIVELHDRALDLPTVMASCDVAISAAGGTLAELGYLGRPTFALSIVPDQVGNARRHVAAELAVGGQRLTDVTDETIAFTVAQLVSDLPLRTRLRAATAAMLDGRGAARALDLLTA